MCKDRERLLLCFGERDAGEAGGKAERAHRVCKTCLDRWFKAHNELRASVGLTQRSRHSCPICRAQLRGSSLRSSRFCLGLLKVLETWPEGERGEGDGEEGDEHEEHADSLGARDSHYAGIAAADTLAREATRAPRNEGYDAPPIPQGGGGGERGGGGGSAAGVAMRDLPTPPLESSITINSAAAPPLPLGDARGGTPAGSAFSSASRIKASAVRERGACLACQGKHRKHTCPKRSRLPKKGAERKIAKAKARRRHGGDAPARTQLAAIALAAAERVIQVTAASGRASSLAADGAQQRRKEEKAKRMDVVDDRSDDASSVGSGSDGDADEAERCSGDDGDGSAAAAATTTTTTTTTTMTTIGRLVVR